MTKREFLEGLRGALMGEIPDAEVINNIRFYEEYINSKASNENDAIEELGDPRLIAKTIIETYQMSHGPLYNNKSHEQSYHDAHTSDGNTYKESHTYHEEDTNNYGKNASFQVHSSLTWYEKLIIILITLVIIVIIVFIGGILLQLFFIIGLPLLIVYFIYNIIKNNSGR